MQFTKRFLLKLLVLECLTSDAAAYAKEAASEQSLSPTHHSGTSSPSSALLTVVPGSLEVERNELAKKIQSAREKGIGIQVYVNLFQEIEKMVVADRPAESIESKLENVDKALSAQLFAIEQARRNRVLNRKQEVFADLKQARLYVLSLVNADRAMYKLSPVALDAVATLAAQRHADEMSSIGYLSHWDVAGKKPDQRYSEAGGTHSTGENCAYTFSNRITSNNLFSSRDLDALESSFMDEIPPGDGHRRQILRPEHNKLGIGLSSRTDLNGHSRVSLVQEFINEYGVYEKLPNKIFRMKPFVVSGRLFPGCRIKSISIHWELKPKPMTVAELSKTHSYELPDSIVSSLPDGKLATGKTWMKEGSQQFSVAITPPKDWQSGLYYILVWAEQTKGKVQKEILVSTRTTQLD